MLDQHRDTLGTAVMGMRFIFLTTWEQPRRLVLSLILEKVDYKPSAMRKMSRILVAEITISKSSLDQHETQLPWLNVGI